jgi:hypothetical protein
MVVAKWLLAVPHQSCGTALLFASQRAARLLQNIWKDNMNLLVRFSAMALLAAVVGCSGKPTVGGTETVDATQVSNTISGMTDAAQDPAKLAKLFVTAPDAATAAKYKDYLYFQGAKPTVTGATAKVKMRLEKPAGTLAGEPEWEFEKSGETWKIKSAPLP